MTISVITLFPEQIKQFFDVSISKRAQEQEKIILETIDLRQFGIGTHKTVDDKPYGGGVGMVLKVDVLDKAISYAKQKKGKTLTVLLDPKGKVYTQPLAEHLIIYDHLILICGHYEGYDERIRNLVDMEISLGDFILSGGEIAALAIIDSLIRIIPGVLKQETATHLESFSYIEGKRILEYPQYTRPEEYKGMKVPEILLSGNPKKIAEFQKTEALKLTQERRPELLKVIKD